MRLHLLEHDPVDMSDTYLIRWAQKKEFTISQTYLCNNEKLPSLESFDWLMIMGGSQHIWEEEHHAWLLPEKKLIADALEQNKMILGICFGAQLLAESLGGTVSTNTHKEIGWHELTLTSEGRTSPLFQNITDQFSTFHWHSDHCSLPPGCVLLAQSKTTQNQAFILEGKPIAGLQFHPEYTRQMVTHFSKEFGHEWGKGPHITPSEIVVQQTKERDDGYGLMAAILDNMLEKS
jgi:GMP synthase-like glutamine amidotransferase